MIVLVKVERLGCEIIICFIRSTDVILTKVLDEIVDIVHVENVTEVGIIHEEDYMLLLLCNQQESCLK